MDTSANAFDLLFSCVCPNAFAGRQCDVAVQQDCEAATCFNNGTCHDDSGDVYDGFYSCVCPVGTSGRQCQSLLQIDCVDRLCFNSGLCHDVGTPYDSNYTCTCSVGFSGSKCKSVQQADCQVDTCSNGGTCVDFGTAFDKNFSCVCTTEFTGVRCDSTLGSTSAASSSSSSSSALIGGIGGGLGALLLLLLLLLVLIRRRRSKNAPHNFESMLELVHGFGADENGAMIPREIKRSCVKIVGSLGKGNFGSVDKAILDEQQSLGIPGYLVACKQLLSTRNEDRVSLLEEAVVMAQFSNAHCVHLIGVVTIGNPVMVCAFKKNTLHLLSLLIVNVTRMCV